MIKHFKKYKKAMTLLVTLTMTTCLLMPLSACGNKNSDGTGDTTKEINVDDAESFVTTYPLTVTDHLGRTVTIDSEPQKIASGSYALSSILIALGKKENVTAIEDNAASKPLYALSTDNFQTLPTIGSDAQINTATLGSVKPDVVFVSTKAEASISAIEGLGVKVIALDNSDISLLFESIDIIGQVTNTYQTANDIKERINEGNNTILNKITDKSANLTACLTASDTYLSVAGSKLFQSSIIENAGLRNAAAEFAVDTYSAVTADQIAAWNPDFIVIPSDATYTVDAVKNDPALASCKAVQNNHVIKMPAEAEILNLAVPASFIGSAWLASVAYPEQFTNEEYLSLSDDFYFEFYGYTKAE